MHIEYCTEMYQIYELHCLKFRKKFRKKKKKIKSRINILMYQYIPIFLIKIDLQNSSTSQSCKLKPSKKPENTYAPDTHQYSRIFQDNRILFQNSRSGRLSIHPRLRSRPGWPCMAATHRCTPKGTNVQYPDTEAS